MHLAIYFSFHPPLTRPASLRTEEEQEQEEQVILCDTALLPFSSTRRPSILLSISKTAAVSPKSNLSCDLIRLQCHKYTSRLLWLQTPLSLFFLFLSFLWLWTQKEKRIYLRILMRLILDWCWKFYLQSGKRERENETLVLKRADTVCAIHTVDQWGIMGFSK